MALTQDSRLRQYLLGTVVTLLMTVGSCVGHDLYARVSALEKNDAKSTTGIAVVQQDLKDFRDSFNKFVDDDKEWKRNNGRDGGKGNR